MNVPNIISIFRIFLIPFFVYFYFNVSDDLFWISSLILLISGFTDMLDGIIARRYNMITTLGKILDPLADKLTQAALTVCLAIKYNELIVLFIVFLIKEILIICGGCSLIKGGVPIIPAKWFGKVSTFVFYAFTFVLILFRNAPKIIVNIYQVVIILFILFSLLMYIFEYFNIKKLKLDSSKEKINDL